MSQADDNKKPWYRSRFFGLGIVLVVLVVTISAWFVYVAWQSSSEKALLDSLAYAQKNPASYHVSMDGKTDMEVETDGTLFAFSGKLDNIDTEGVINGMDIYMKSSAPQKFITMVTPKSGYLAAGSTVQNIIKTYATSLKGKWLKMSIDELQQSSPEMALLQCGMGIMSGLKEEEELASNLGDAYLSNQFISSKATTNSGQEQTYVYSIATEKLRSFMNDLSFSDIGKKTTGCEDLPRLLAGEPSTWYFSANIHKPDHYIKSITINNADKKVMTINADYTAHPNITIPQDVLTFQEITNDIFSLFLNKK